MIVPDLPEDVRSLKAAVGRFVETEVYPLETRVAERGSIDPAELEALRRKAREAGFAMLNMPPELGGRDLPMLGQVALEEESGKATNGLGFAVVDRGPRELHEIATPSRSSGTCDRSRTGSIGRPGRSPSPARAPTSRGSRRPPCATVTSGC